MTQQGSSHTVDRPNRGVRLHAPSQPGLTIEPTIQDYDFVPTGKQDYASPRDTADFKVIRALVTFEVLSSPDVDTFGKPAILTVCYKQTDIDAAGGRNKLKLGAWNGRKWQILPQRPAHDIPFTGRDFVGAVEVLLTKPWVDPPVAWGS